MRVAKVVLFLGKNDYASALNLLKDECYPTLGRGREVLVSLWKAAVILKAQTVKGGLLTGVEAHHARLAMPVPKNIGCPYATLYCEQYW